MGIESEQRFWFLSLRVENSQRGRSGETLAPLAPSKSEGRASTGGPRLLASSGRWLFWVFEDLVLCLGKLRDREVEFKRERERK